MEDDDTSVIIKNSLLLSEKPFVSFYLFVYDFSFVSVAGTLFQGRMAVCNLACESLSSTSVPPDQAQRKLYIGGLSPDTTSEMLLFFFGRHGEIEEGSVAYDKDTNKSRYRVICLSIVLRK